MGLLQKNIALLLLMSLLILKILAVPVVCMQYKLNKAYISANLCENKSKPQLHCEGKCHLKKQLAKTNDTPDSRNNENAGKTITVDYFTAVSAEVYLITLSSACFFSDYRDHRSSGDYCGNIFRPPSSFA